MGLRFLDFLFSLFSFSPLPFPAPLSFLEFSSCQAVFRRKWFYCVCLPVAVVA